MEHIDGGTIGGDPLLGDDVRSSARRTVSRPPDQSRQVALSGLSFKTDQSRSKRVGIAG